MKTDRHQTKRSADTDWRIAIVYSDFYKDDMQTMTKHAVNTLRAAGLPEEGIDLYPVPGAFEIPLIGKVLAEAEEVDAIIGLGIIVEGETHHARLVAENCARGMMDIQTAYGLPFVNEVLYVDTIDLAKARLYKGEDAANVALDSLALLRGMQS